MGSEVKLFYINLDKLMGFILVLYLFLNHILFYLLPFNLFKFIILLYLFNLSLVMHWSCFLILFNLFNLQLCTDLVYLFI